MRGFKRWLKRLAVSTLMLVGIVALVVYLGRAHFRIEGDRELAAVTTGLDTADPGWRIDAITAERQKALPPADANSTTVIAAAAEELPKDWQKWQLGAEWVGHSPSNFALTPKNLDDLKGNADPTRDARLTARRLRGMPNGAHTIVVADNPYMTLLPHLDKTRQVAALLQYDAFLAATEDDTELAFRDAHAILNVARSVADEPILISQLVRMACGSIAAKSAMQTLAWTTPKTASAELAELQAAFAAEADVPWMLHGIRGERASVHKTFEGLESGKLTVDDMVGLGMQRPGILEHSAFRLYKAFLPGDHAECLRLMTAYLDVAKLPPHEQRAAFKQITLPPRPPQDFRYVVTNLLLPAIDKVAEAGLRVRAELLTASVAVACERYRIATGKWPEELADIPKDILPDVPLDPFDGKPLKFLADDDGVVVFSLGADWFDEKPRNTYRQGPVNGRGIGWRLWNPAKRGLPPPPEPKPDDGIPEPDR